MGGKELNIEALEQPQFIGYAQSANTLFNFMELSDYLKQTLTRKAFIPRYYIENVDFLNLVFDGDMKLKFYKHVFATFLYLNYLKRNL